MNNPTLTSSTLQSSFLRLQRAFTSTHGRQKTKHESTTWYIKNWADSGNLTGFGSQPTFGFGGQLITPKCPTFHIPETLATI